jgi:hypothetical protein
MSVDGATVTEIQLISLSSVLRTMNDESMALMAALPARFGLAAVSSVRLGTAVNNASLAPSNEQFPSILQCQPHAILIFDTRLRPLQRLSRAVPLISLPKLVGLRAFATPPTPVSRFPTPELLSTCCLEERRALRHPLDFWEPIPDPEESVARR